MPPRKRAASSAADQETPARRPRRAAAAAGAAKSHYFEHAVATDEDDDVPVKKKPRGRPPRVARAAAAAAVVGEDYGLAKKGRRSKKVVAPAEEEEEEEEEEDDDDDDDDDDGDYVKDGNDGQAYIAQDDDKGEQEDYDDDERKITIIPLKQLRPDGGVSYADDRLHPNTMLFLQELKDNNYRSWLKSNDAEFRRALKDFHTYIDSFTPLLVAVDDTIPGELPVKDVVFRIYRDTRFSKDSTPYKPYFSAAWSRTGRKGPYAVYYLHCEPPPSPEEESDSGKGKGKGKPLDEWSTARGSGGRWCMLAGGLWCPDKDALALLRRSIDERPRRWRRVLGDPVLVREFFGDKGAAAKGGKKGNDNNNNNNNAVLAFAEHSSSGALKTKPRDYRPDHRDIALLKLRNFVLTKTIPAELFTAADGQRRIADIFGAMAGFVSFLNSVVMPDPGLDDGEDDEDEDEDGDDGDDNDE